MRLFFAIEPPDDVRDALAAVPLPAGVRRVPRDQLHLTLKFVEGGELADVVAAGRRAIAGPRFAITLRGGGAFPGPSRPKVLWVGVDDPDGRVGALAAALERELPGDGRSFAPHLTLGRARGAVGSIPALLGLGAVGAWEVREVVLVESRLGSAGAAHLPRERFSLG